MRARCTSRACDSSTCAQVCQGEVLDALTHAQLHLAPFRSSAKAVPEHDALLHDVLALLAYKDPRDSPVAALTTDAHRSQVADTVNSAMIRFCIHQARGKPEMEVDDVPKLPRSQPRPLRSEQTVFDDGHTEMAPVPPRPPPSKRAMRARARAAARAARLGRPCTRGDSTVSSLQMHLSQMELVLNELRQTRGPWGGCVEPITVASEVRTLFPPTMMLQDS